MSITSRYLKSSDYHFDAQRRVFIHQSMRDIPYSDGAEIEARLSQILSDDRYFDDPNFCYRHIRDWPTCYHLSPLRPNAIRHLCIDPNAEILELGAGTGAITHYLGSVARNVVAVEGTLRRASIAASRCRRQPNVEIACANIDQISLEHKFDFVFMVGVLEYAAVFSNDANPFDQYLRIARQHLGDGGHLVLAIENQLGLKYLAGAPEDHLNRVGVGVEGLYGAKTAATFGRSQLSEMLTRCGFASVYFQYAFPDYKHTMILITDDGVRDEKFQVGEILSSHLRRVPKQFGSLARTQSFDESLAWRAVARNGLVSDLANSFVIVASPAHAARSIVTPGLLAATYNQPRRMEFACVNEFRRVADDIVVGKRALHGAGGRTADIVQKLGEARYIAGQVLETMMVVAARQNDFEGFVRCVCMWIVYLRERAGGLGFGDSVDSGLVDCNPRNLIVADGGIAAIDQEWCTAEMYTMRAIVMHYFAISRRLFAEVVHRNMSGRGSSVEKMVSYLGMCIDDGAWSELRRLQKAMGEISPECRMSSSVRKFRRSMNDQRYAHVLYRCVRMISRSIGPERIAKAIEWRQRAWSRLRAVVAVVRS